MESMGIHGAHGNPWKSMGVHRNPWVSMGTHGHPWSPWVPAECMGTMVPIDILDTHGQPFHDEGVCTALMHVQSAVRRTIGADALDELAPA
jgi:hypothetical protein